MQLNSTSSKLQTIQDVEHTSFYLPPCHPAPNSERHSLARVSHCPRIDVLPCLSPATAPKPLLHSQPTAITPDDAHPNLQSNRTPLLIKYRRHSVGASGPKPPGPGWNGRYCSAHIKARHCIVCPKACEKARRTNITSRNFTTALTFRIISYMEWS